MIEHALYFGKKEFYDIIRNVGGVWNDSKERPLVCLLKLSENDNIYWAIPMGNLDHRDENAKRRIEKFLSYTNKDIRSCFYHIGRTDVYSIFFISDAVPITDKYIEQFNILLLDYYNTDKKDELKDFLYENAIHGITGNI